MYSVRERAALAWCEYLTPTTSPGGPDDPYDLVAAFDPDETVAFTLAVVAIKESNRLAAGLRSPVDCRQRTPPAYGKRSTGR